MKKIFGAAIASFSGAILLSSCFLGGGGLPTSTNPGALSSATGLEYNEEGAFQVNDYSGQPAGPNLVFIFNAWSITDILHHFIHSGFE